MVVLNALKTFWDWIIGMGVTVVMPFMVIVLGAIFGAKLNKSLQGAVKIAVGFTALYTLSNKFLDPLSGVVNAIQDKIHLSLDVIDIGWVLFGGIGWGITYAALVAVGFFLLNWILLRFNVVKTLNVDFNNYWIITLYMYAIQITTGNFVLALVAGIVFWFGCTKMSDWIAPWIEPYYKMPTPGITVSHFYAIMWAPIGFIMDKVWDKVPVIKDIKLDPASMKRKFGFFGENLFVGFTVGTIIGLVAYVELPLTLDALGKALTLGFVTGMFMHLIPRTTELILAGLGPLSEAIRQFVTKKMPGKDFYVGLDVAVCVGAPENGAVGVMAAPIALIIALILPWNRVIPMGNLTTFIFSLTFLVNTNKGNILRGILNAAIFYLPIALLVSGAMAETNALMINSIPGLSMPDGLALVTTISLGGVPTLWALMTVCQFFYGATTLTSFICAIGILVLFYGSWFIMRHRSKEFYNEIVEANNAGLR